MAFSHSTLLTPQSVYSHLNQTRELGGPERKGNTQPEKPLKKDIHSQTLARIVWSQVEESEGVSEKREGEGKNKTDMFVSDVPGSAAAEGGLRGKTHCFCEKRRLEARK